MKEAITAGDADCLAMVLAGVAKSAFTGNQQLLVEAKDKLEALQMRELLMEVIHCSSNTPAAIAVHLSTLLYLVLCIDQH